MTRPPPPSPAPFPRISLALVLVLALGVRLALRLHRGGPLWFDEAVPVTWATRLWGFERGHFDPDPHGALGPPLSAYAFFLPQLAAFGLGRARGASAGLADFQVAAFLDPWMLRGSAMLGAIAIGVGAIAAAARLTRRVAGPG